MNPVNEFRRLPGPKGLPLVGNLFQLNPGRIHAVLEGWARTFGPLYRVRALTREALILSDHQGIMQVLRDRPGTFRRSKTIASVMEDMGVTGVVSAEGEHWKRLSRLTMRAFNPAHLRGFFPQVVKVTRRLLSRWRRLASQNAVVDVHGDLMRYTLDVTASLAFGSDINTIEGDNDVVRHLNRMFPMIHRRVNMPVPYWRYFKLPADRSFDRDLRALHIAIDAFIAQARARMRANPVLLEHPANLIEALVAARDEADSGFTDEDVFGNVFSTLLAGGDGTANMIAWVVYFLCDNQAWQRTLQCEVDAILADHSYLSEFEALSSPFPNVDAVIQEAMRLKPVFPILLHEANYATSIAGVSVPAGTIIVLLLRLTGLDSRHFPNPERFEPARWLQAAGPDDSATSISRLPFTFGSGPRMCPGRLLAIEELKMVVTMLVRNFTFERAGESHVEESMRFTMGPTNLHVKLRERHPQ